MPLGLTEQPNTFLAGPVTGPGAQASYRLITPADLPGGTGSGSVVSIDVQPAGGSIGITSAGGPVTTTGTITLTLSAELQGVAALNATGYVVRTGAGTYTTQPLTNQFIDPIAVSFFGAA